MITNGKHSKGSDRLVFLAAIILITQSGCSPFFLGKAPAIQKGPTRMHLTDGEPFVCLHSLVDNRNNTAGVLVRVQTYETAMKDFRNQQAEIAANTNSVPLTAPRAMVLVDAAGVHLVVDGQHQLLDTQALMGGPWIYYLNDDKTFCRIRVPAGNVQQFAEDLQNQTPRDFVKKWCDNQPATEPLNDVATSRD